MDLDSMSRVTNGFSSFKIESPDKKRIKPTPKRYVILVLYAICSMQKSFQWISLSSITDKVAFYYGVDNIAVNWTSILFMVTFVPLVLPSSWLIGRIGLRKAVLIGGSGFAVGAAIKCIALANERFYVVMLGQIIVSISEQFIFCIPARIASVWFPDHQVTLAMGFGIFGNQCGIALGFIVPPMMMRGLVTRDEIGSALGSLYIGTATTAALTWFLLLFLFDEAPKYAPGQARLRKMQDEDDLKDKAMSFVDEMKWFGNVLKGLMTNFNVNLLIVAYGINVGSGYAIQTVLNQLITSSWPDSGEVVGTAGLILIICGMAGALFWGHLCDVTHKYITITRLLYIGAIISMLMFGATIKLQMSLALYSAAALMGFMLIGYTVAGLDTMVELTYPAPELVSTSVMNLSPQIFGTPITFLCSAIADDYDSNTAVGFLVGCLSVGLIITMTIKEHLNRQSAAQSRDET